MIYPQNFEQKIGFDQIRQLLKDRCLSTLGEERVSDMVFSDQYEEVEEKLNQVTEFIRIIQEEDGFPDQFFFDVRPSLKRVRIEGMYLDEQELFDLRRSLKQSAISYASYIGMKRKKKAIPLPQPETISRRYSRISAINRKNRRYSQ